MSSTNLRDATFRHTYAASNESGVMPDCRIHYGGIGSEIPSHVGQQKTYETKKVSKYAVQKARKILSIHKYEHAHLAIVV